MPVLTVGGTQIPYSIRFSRRARRLSIRVTPHGVEAVAPAGVPERRLVAFVETKRLWILRKVTEHSSTGEGLRLIWPERFVTGARIPFHGRNMQLHVRDADVPEVQVRYRNAFMVLKPVSASEADVRKALERWRDDNLRDDIDALIGLHAPPLGVCPGRIRISRPKTRWGSCGRKNDLLFHAMLSAAPGKVLEYVVVHELCHIRHRNHGITFWRLVEEVLPDYRLHRSWLREYGRLLSV
jgi:predicted metal-dependent hydrolase